MTHFGANKFHIYMFCTVDIRETSDFSLCKNNNGTYWLVTQEQLITSVKHYSTPPCQKKHYPSLPLWWVTVQICLKKMNGNTNHTPRKRNVTVVWNLTLLPCRVKRKVTHSQYPKMSYQFSFSRYEENMKSFIRQMCFPSVLSAHLPLHCLLWVTSEIYRRKTPTKDLFADI